MAPIATAMLLGGCGTMGPTLSSAFTMRSQDIGTCQHGVKPVDNASLDTLERTVALEQVWRRAEACRRWYGSVSGVAVAADLGGSVVSGSGTTALLVSTGKAAATTNTYLGALTIAPSIVRDVLRQEPQAALAFQAMEATVGAQCHVVKVRLGLRSLAPRYSDLTAAIAGATEQRRQLRIIIAGMLVPAAEKPPKVAAAKEQTEAELQASGAPDSIAKTPTFAEQVAKNSDLRELIRLSQQLDAAIIQAEELQRQIASELGIPVYGAKIDDKLTKTIDARVALGLDQRITSIFSVYLQEATRLAPTPEATVRSVVAAPFSLTAKLIQGKGQSPTDPEAVQRATYDFSPTRISYGVRQTTMAVTPQAPDKMLISPARWDTLDSASKELRSLAAAVRMASQSVNGLAAVDQQATCVVSPAPGVPPAPFTAPEVVATGAPANAVTKAQASLDPQ